MLLPGTVVLDIDEQKGGPMRLRLGTRESALGVARGEAVAQRLRDQGHDVELVMISDTAGDASDMPGEPSPSGDFAATVRASLLAGECDAVVHAYKDIPLDADTAEGITKAAVPQRGNPRDALVTWDGVGLAALPQQSRIGTSSLRRIAQLKRLRPDLVIVDVKGTFAERLRRVEPGDLDALIVSMAGLDMLGLADRVSEVLPFLPAAAQGTLVVECRSDDLDSIQALTGIDDEETRICTTAERSVLTALDVDYSAPIGTLADRQVVLSLQAAAFSVTGEKMINVQVGMPTSMLHAERTGRTLADALRKRGAHEFCNRAEVEAAGIIEQHDEDAWEPHVVPGAARLFLPRQDGRLAATLRDAGFAVDAITLQRAKLVPADNILDRADWIVVPSAYTVWALRERGWQAPEGGKVAAMGDTTRAILEAAGVQVDIGPEGTASSTRVLDEFAPSQGERVVIPCASDLSTRLEDGLRDKGYEVERLEVYQMVDVEQADPELRTDWDSGEFSYVLLSSPSVAESFLRVLGARDDVATLAWDEATADVLRDAGVRVAAVAPSKDVAGVQALAQAVGVTVG
ncbi:MAG: hydroxymethylbilane synthase [Arachnia sp.]